MSLLIAAPVLLPLLIAAPVLLPLLGAALCLVALHSTRIQYLIATAMLVGLMGTSVTLLLVVHYQGIHTVQIGGWDAPLGITLVADRLSTLLLAISALVLTSVHFFASSQGIHDGRGRQPTAIYIPTYLILAAGVADAFLAGDLFNLYVGFEMLLMASYVLLTLGASPDRVRAGVSYVVVSVVSSVLFLLALALVYAATGTVNLAHLALRIPELPNGTQAAICGTLLVAFGIKAAVFPLSTWLPDSYPTAPAPVTAVFAGLLTKVGVYAMMRVLTLFSAHDTFSTVLLLAGLATMLVGIAGAIPQNDLKRLLSFTLVSHIGFMIFGLGLGTVAGLSGAIFYTAHHILVQTALFLVVGLIERQAGSASLRRLGSLSSTLPGVTILFFLAAMNLGGIPPLSGFVGKTALIQGAVQRGDGLAWVLIAGSVLTSLLTLYVMVRVWTKAFWRDRRDAPEGELSDENPSALLASGESTIRFADRTDVGRIPLGMTIPTAVLVLAGVALAVGAGPLMEVSTASAENLLDRHEYVDAVLGDDAARLTEEAR